MGGRIKERSILFQLGGWTVGGVERVTVVLANEFVRRGHRVAVSAYRFDDRRLLGDLHPDVEIVCLDGGFSGETAKRLREVLERRSVSVVLNQWCADFRHARFLRRAMAGLHCRLVSVHHNRPDANKRIMDARHPLVRWLWRRLTASSLRRVYRASDRYVVLSPGFIDLFSSFTGLRSCDKLVAIPNPATVVPRRDVAFADKENVVLYVGRLEETQKRVSRVLDVWRRIHASCPSWRLEIVGDGPDRARYEAQAADLPRVRFTGVREPDRFYEKAKVLLLPSDFEGFPLVLCEAMGFGCVPVALGSYAAATDILGGGDACGRVVETPWDEERFSGAVCPLLSDYDRLSSMSEAAKWRAGDFSASAVAGMYENLMASGSEA